MANVLPKLRAIDMQPIVQGGRQSILLRDPLRLSPKTVVIPQQLAPVLALCDGTRDTQALRASLAVRYGLPLSTGVIEQLLRALDEALLLENERFYTAKEQALRTFREAPFRPPALAGSSYPAEASALQKMFAELCAQHPETPEAEMSRGLLSPHIDYARGGPVYARIWQRASEAVRQAELIVLLGTDHYGSPGQLTLTRQHYATPWGVLPTDQEVVNALAAQLGEETAFAEEIHHRSEHSIELAATWLHYIRQGEPCQLVPILCGSFQPFIQGEADPAENPAIAATVNTLKEVLAARHGYVVIAGDLAHVGPAFGGPPVDLIARSRLQASDEELIERICAGDAAGFMAKIKETGDRNQVCGVPPIYIALRLLAPTRGEKVAYERCPADPQGTSWVSICGLTLY